MDWGLYPNFKQSEFACHHTGKCNMRPEFMAMLQRIRTVYDHPMIVNSGYRDRTHPDERDKKTDGEHVLGLAADIRVNGVNALYLLQVMINLGITRIGLNQKGDIHDRYIHIGMGDKFGLFPPAIWTY